MLSDSAKQKILVCDDDVGILDVIETILTENSYEVEICPGHSELLDKLGTFKPDLILMDLNLDGGRIEERMKLLRGSAKGKSIPIVLMSGGRNVESVVYQVGAQDSLSKPFELEDLLSMVRKYLQ